MNPNSVIASSSAENLNHDCFCRTLNMGRLREQLESEPSLQGMTANITQTRPNLFSSTVVFVSQEVEQQITATVAAIERVAALPGYQSQTLSRANASAQPNFGPLGACMGYDFHLSPEGPKLIEINTNAGGLLLNVALVRSQDACCDEMDWAFPSNARRDTLRKAIFEMFAAEWQLQRGAAPWQSVVIMDDAPADQYLAPEFELFRQLFAQNGIHAAIADASELEWKNGQLMHQNKAVDMVYNRLTDFYLTHPKHAALRQAHAANAVVLTPHPRAHALLADKRNLIALSQNELLAAWGASSADRKLLAHHVPTTRLVTTERADELWAQRRQLFFKPVAGYGAKAAYRGDKLTRRVWTDILESDFVAQALVPPSARTIRVDGVLSELKFDIRAYSYAGKVQLLAARMYAGQTTNFRTQGGGFAPVIVVPSAKLVKGVH